MRTIKFYLEKQSKKPSQQKKLRLIPNGLKDIPLIYGLANISIAMNNFNDQRYLMLPHFSLKKDGVFFLEKYHYLKFGRQDISADIREKIFIDEGIIVEKKNYSWKTDLKVLVLEPHSDDFALSASGFVLDKLKYGVNFSVLNLFSRTALNNFPWKHKCHLSSEEYEALRLKESNFAIVKYLGGKFASLKFESLSLIKKPNQFNEQFFQAIYSIIHTKTPDVVMLPMAVQEHPDHIATFELGPRLILSFPKIKFILYEDLPYARNKYAYIERLGHIKKRLKISEILIDCEHLINSMADLAIIYRSQFDDINRAQMKAIIEQDCRAVAAESNFSKEFAKRFFEVEGIK